MTILNSLTRIAYKWVIKDGELYYPLINYRIDYHLDGASAEPYRLGVIYKNPVSYNPTLDVCRNPWQIPGYHVWKKPINDKYRKWIKYLDEINQRPFELTVLEVMFHNRDVIKENKERLVTRSFVVKGEVHVRNRLESELVRY